MAKRYLDMTEDEQMHEGNFLESTLKPDIEQRTRHSEFGICCKCASFSITETEFDVVRAVCMRFASLPLLLTSAHPVRYCSSFTDEHEMELYEMKEMAYYIETPKRKVGF